jgi:hypothetical protein
MAAVELDFQYGNLFREVAQRKGVSPENTETVRVSFLSTLRQLLTCRWTTLTQALTLLRRIIPLTSRVGDGGKRREVSILGIFGVDELAVGVPKQAVSDGGLINRSRLVLLPEITATFGLPTAKLTEVALSRISVSVTRASRICGA